MVPKAALFANVFGPSVALTGVWAVGILEQVRNYDTYSINNDHHKRLRSGLFWFPRAAQAAFFVLVLTVNRVE